MKPEGSRHHRAGPEIGAESGYLFPGSAGRLKSLFQELALNELDAVTAPETGQVLMTGSQVCSTDDKGRLIIPKRIRDAWPDPRYAVVAAEPGVLWLVREKDYREVLRGLIKSSSTDEFTSKIRDSFLRASHLQLSLDGASRITFPERLRKIVDPDKEMKQSSVVLLGSGNIIEVMGIKAHEELCKKLRGDEPWEDLPE